MSVKLKETHALGLHATGINSLSQYRTKSNKDLIGAQAMKRYVKQMVGK